jgi:signal transduction histidine kinase
MKTPRSFVSRWWIFGAIFAALLVCALVSWLHFQQQQALRQATSRLENFRQARIELGQGFLHASLAGDAGSPFDREEGTALLRQAIASFDLALKNLAVADAEVAAAFRRSVVAFEERLTAWNRTRSPSAGQAAELRIAFHQLENQADRVDAQTRRQLQALAARLDVEYAWALGSAVLLLAGICVVLVRGERARQRAELEIRQLNAELEQRVQARTAELHAANRELETFAHSVAHDLRAPLRTMSGFSLALLEDCSAQLDAHGREYARLIGEAAQRMDRLIRDLLDYSRVARAEIRTERTALDQVVSGVCRQLAAELAARQVALTVEEPLPLVRGNSTLLGQVVANLLDNACKFVAPGVKPQVRVRAELRDGTVRLWVEDNGIGIAPEHQEQVFRIFERLHGQETYPGTGIGLAIVRKAAERLGGQVGVESQPGAGARFWIDLPAA